MSDRSGDWMRQARHDLEHARACKAAGSHDWACFAAQQAAEKAVKALHLRLGQEAWGQLVGRLLAELPAGTGVTPELPDRARVLDALFIPTRYPNAHPEGAPFEHYGPLQADEAIRHADAIVSFCDHAMAGCR